MNRSALALILSPLLLSAPGCGTWTIYDRNAQMREQTDREHLREQIGPIKERVEALETETQQLGEKLGAAERSSEERVRGVEERLTQMEQRLAAADAARESDKKEIIDRLSKNVADILARQQATSTRPSGGGRGEHVVQPGETLSQIAARYKVKADSLIEANGLKDPNSIRAGQKLVIPE